LPEAITNFLALLGWNPGVKTADGKDLEKFDMAFLAANFSVERIGKSSAKFDRAKLLSFNADAINAMGDEEFAGRWRAWCEEYEPGLVKRFTDRQFALLATAVRQRAKTFRDALRPLAFAMVDDDQVQYDPAAVQKNLKANARAGFHFLEEL